jgi:hypothetical protein
MFSPKEMSIQQVSKLGGEQQDTIWVLVIKLDTENKKGYLDSQLQDNKCKDLPYLPYTEIGIQLFKDDEKCCVSKDYQDCKQGCKSKVERVGDVNADSLAFRMSVTGSIFSVKKDDMLLEGTRFTYTGEKPNKLQLGYSVNAVSNIQEATALLEISSTGFTKDNFEEFKKEATQNIEARPIASDMFAGVKYDGVTFTFNCVDSKKLCKQLTIQSTSDEDLVYSHSGNVFKLTGDGKFTRYGYFSKTTRRRRLLQPPSNLS